MKILNEDLNDHDIAWGRRSARALHNPGLIQLPYQTPRDQVRKRLQADVEKFLAAGGRIQQC